MQYIHEYIAFIYDCITLTYYMFGTRDLQVCTLREHVIRDKL